GSRGFTLRRRPDGDGGLTWSEAGLPDFVGILPLTGAHRGSQFSAGGSIGTENVWLMGSKSPATSGPVYDVLFKGAKKTDGSGDYTWSDSSFGTCEGNPPCDGVWFTRAIWSTSRNSVYLASDNGQLRHWDGNNFTFVKTTVQKIPLYKNLYAMWGTSDTDLWIVGDDVALHKVAPSSARKP
ncbi:MAG: hypothetical protein K0S65_3955, partial [Labilithrix sp.]|nr:hypothetical protein [Labilithrix sp.]